MGDTACTGDATAQNIPTKGRVAKTWRCITTYVGGIFLILLRLLTGRYSGSEIGSMESSESRELASREKPKWNWRWKRTDLSEHKQPDIQNFLDGPRMGGADEDDVVAKKWSHMTPGIELNSRYITNLDRNPVSDLGWKIANDAPQYPAMEPPTEEFSTILAGCENHTKSHVIALEEELERIYWQFINGAIGLLKSGLQAYLDHGLMSPVDIHSLDILHQGCLEDMGREYHMRRDGARVKPMEYAYMAKIRRVNETYKALGLRLSCPKILLDEAMAMGMAVDRDGARPEDEMHFIRECADMRRGVKPYKGYLKSRLSHCL
ncbi:hypothetical protein B0T25DRAFT_560494, partial [Lasiosphaeria hispida]